MYNIKVSVIITTYKRPNDVLRAVQSCLSQTLKEIEIIVVDDNSPETDERRQTALGIESLQKQDQRLLYIQHDKNMNGSVARNTGIQAARGEFLSFLDDDDYYLPGKLEKEYYTASSLPAEYAGVLCDCYIARNGKIVKSFYSDDREQALVPVLACNFRMGSGSNLFVRRCVANEIGGFDENLLRHQDLDFLVRVFAEYKLYKIHEPLFVVELFSTHLNVPNLEKIVKTKKQLFNKYKTLINALPVKEKSEIFGCNYIRLYEAAIANKKYKEAWKYYKKSVKFSSVNSSRKRRMTAIFLYSFFPVWVKQLIRRGR